MQECHAVYFVRTDNTEICHSYLFWVGLFDQRQNTKLMIVPWIFFTDLIKPEVVDEINEL